MTKDFAGHFDRFQNVNRQAIDSINRWVSDQTNNKIDRVIDTLPPSSRLVGVNTVYFKGKWLEPFGTEFTREADFHVTRNEKIQVQTMAAEPDIDYVEDNSVGCKMIALPYEVDGLFSLLNQFICITRGNYRTNKWPCTCCYPSKGSC